MAVSVTGSSGLSMTGIRTILVAAAVSGGLGFYLYGPVVTPLLHAAAVSECNHRTGGNFRSYQLGWVVGIDPHWSCSDGSEPAAEPVDLGWWVTPGR